LAEVRPQLCLAWLFSVSFSGQNSIDHRSEVPEVVGLFQELFDGRTVENKGNFKVLRLAALLGRRRETRLAVMPGKWPPLTAPKTVETYAGPFWLAINAIWRQQPKFLPRRLFP
jgi:hypothetical protein